MPEKLKSLLRSRRFWMAVAGVVAVVSKELLGLDESQVLSIAAVVWAWIHGDTRRPTT